MKTLKWIALLLCLLLSLSGIGIAEESVEAPEVEPELVTKAAFNLLISDPEQQNDPQIPSLTGDSLDDEDGELVILTKDYDDELDVYEATGNEITLQKGDKLLITLDGYKASSWSSSNSKVASVTRLNKTEAKVKALKGGSCTLTCKTTKGKKVKVKVEVEDPYSPSKVYIENENLEDKKMTMYVGQTDDLEAVVEPDTAETTFTWKSSSSSTVGVSKNGHIRAKKAGSAKITVKTKNDKKYTITITSKANKVKGINPKPTKSDIKDLDGEVDFWLKSVEITDTGKLKCRVYLLNGRKKAVKYLKDATFDVCIDGTSIATHTFSKIKVSCSKQSYKEFEIVFPKDDLSDFPDEDAALPTYDADSFEIETDIGTMTSKAIIE